MEFDPPSCPLCEDDIIPHFNVSEVNNEIMVCYDCAEVERLFCDSIEGRKLKSNESIDFENWVTAFKKWREALYKVEDMHCTFARCSIYDKVSNTP